MATEKDTELVEKLIDKTRDGQVSWEEGPAMDSYILRLDSATIIVKKLNLTRGYGYELRLVDSNGNEILEVKETTGGSDMYSLLDTLFEHADRSHNQVDQTIDQILRDLEE